MKRWPLRGRNEMATPLSRLGKTRTPCASQNSSPGFTEPTLALVRGQAHAPNRSPRAKCRHCSARALSGLTSFADRSTPLH
jgi:hypothetical protein